MSSLKFKITAGCSSQTIDRMIHASTSVFRWPEWCNETPLETPLRELISYISSRDIVVEVLELGGVVIFIPSMPVSPLLTGHPELSPMKVASFYDDHLLLTADSFLSYQAVFNSFIEFVEK
jgi:hypothetical protein